MKILERESAAIQQEIREVEELLRTATDKMKSIVPAHFAAAECITQACVDIHMAGEWLNKEVNTETGFIARVTATPSTIDKYPENPDL